MKKRQREILSEACDICNLLGGELDCTSTAQIKFIDRQRALMDVYHVLYAALCDNPENDDSDEDYSRAYLALEKLRGLKNKIYPDRNGNY